MKILLLSMSMGIANTFEIRHLFDIFYSAHERQSEAASGQMLPVFITTLAASLLNNLLALFINSFGKVFLDILEFYFK